MKQYKTLRNVFISVFFSLLVVSLILIIKAESPLQTLYDFFILPFTNRFYLGNLLDKTSLILLCAVGFILSSKLGFFNLGGEGQVYIASIVAVQFALNFQFFSQPMGWLLGCVLAFFVAAILGLISIILKIYLNISEIISTYLFSSAIIPFLDYSISEYFRDETGNLLATPYIDTSWEFLTFLVPSSLNISIIFVLIISIISFIILKYTRYGYEIKVASDNPEFAFSQGIKLTKLSIITAMIGAGLHGLAGAFVVYGSQHFVHSGITTGLGWSGISAALIGLSNPLGAVFGSFLFAWMDAGAKASMIHNNLSFEMSSIIQGLVFLLITLNFFKNRKIKKSCICIFKKRGKNRKWKI